MNSFKNGKKYPFFHEDNLKSDFTLTLIGKKLNIFYVRHIKMGSSDYMQNPCELDKYLGLPMKKKRLIFLTNSMSKFELYCFLECFY